MTENEGQKERIKRLISSLNITTKGFEMKCGLSNGYVSSIRKGIGYKAIEQISDAFPNVNIIWLLTGEGEMYLNECIEENKQRESIPNISPSAMLETLYNEPQRIVYFKGNIRYEEVLPKYALLTTHCGRRTFIVNCLRMGVPAEVIMKWTGHSDYKSMKPYIKIVDKLKASEMEKFNSFGEEPKKGEPEKEPESDDVS